MKIKFILKNVIAIIALTLITTFSSFADMVEQNVIFNNGQLKFGGTLALPDTVNQYPALVLVTGSGLQNRDEEIFGFKIFKQISDYLVQQGYAVFRYDDRGIGESKNEHISSDSITMFDYANDAYSAFTTLKSHKNIDKNKIGFLGHSEGGIISSYLADKYPQDVKFVILMAGPTIAGKDITNYQIEIANRKAGMSEEGIDTVMKYQNLIVNSVCDDAPMDSIIKLLTQVSYSTFQFLPENVKSSITNLEEFAKANAKIQAKSINNQYLKSFWKYNPIIAIKNIKCPMLVLFGEKDQQVPIKLNEKPIRDLIKEQNKKIEIEIIKDANHLFQKAKTGEFSEYSTLEKKFTIDFLPTISKWLNKNIKK